MIYFLIYSGEARLLLWIDVFIPSTEDNNAEHSRCGCVALSSVLIVFVRFVLAALVLSCGYNC